MMAFTTHYDDAGHKSYFPTKELRDLLRNDSIKQWELQQFRSSNRVERLLKEILKKQGFQEAVDKSVWVRKPKGTLKVMKKAGDWFQDNEGQRFVPPAPKPSVAERVSGAVRAFMTEHARQPNKLWISSSEWHELTMEAGHSGHLVNDGITRARRYMGMAVELMAPGTELFVGLAAGGAPKEESEGIHTVAAWLDKHGAPAGKVYLGGQQAGKTQKAIEAAYFKGLEYAAETHVSRPRKSAQRSKPAKKRIVPPSQLKRKLL